VTGEHELEPLAEVRLLLGEVVGILVVPGVLRDRQGSAVVPATAHSLAEGHAVRRCGVPAVVQHPRLLTGEFRGKNPFAPAPPKRCLYATTRSSVDGRCGWFLGVGSGNGGGRRGVMVFNMERGGDEPGAP
jgi:hypothetical protein